MVRVPNAPNPGVVLRSLHRSSGLARLDYCVSAISSRVSRLSRVSNRSRLQLDLPSWLGKSNVVRCGTLLGYCGVIRLVSDGLVLDIAIRHYPS